MFTGIAVRRYLRRGDVKLSQNAASPHFIFSTNPSLLGRPQVVEEALKSSDEGAKCWFWSCGGFVLSELAALVSLGPRAVVPLTRGLEQYADADRFMGRRAIAAAALGLLRDARAIEALSKALWDPQQMVRVTATDALGLIRDPSASKPLTVAVGHEDPMVRRAAAKALEWMGEPEWNELVKGDLDDYTRLSECRDPRAVEPLIEALARMDRAVWRDMEASRGQISYVRSTGDAGASPAMLQALGAGEAQVARAQARAQEAEAYRERMRRRDARDKVYEALKGVKGDARFVEPLTRAFEHVSGNVQAAGALALGQLGEVHAVDVLLQLLSDSCRGHTRVHAARGLGRAGDRRAVGPLIDALNVNERKGEFLDEPDSLDELASLYEARCLAQAASQALGLLGDPRAFSPLIDALNDESEEVRRAAVQALGVLGDPRAIDPLKKALEDRKKGVREAAAEALGKLAQVSQPGS